MMSPDIDWIAETCAREGLPGSYGVAIVDYLRSLSVQILELREDLSKPVIIGVNGGQGSGKSTLAMFLADWLVREHGLSTVSLSLDDLYLSKAGRRELARRHHPLFATRGVPGTHDVELGKRVLDGLVGLRGSTDLRIPSFDKAANDLRDQDDWPVVRGPVDVVVFEGWCVGVKPQVHSALVTPVNSLERDEDPDARWRTTVNEHLKSDYAELFSRLDMLVMLRIPSFEKAIEWRRLQESKLPEPISEEQLLRFMMHFERLTRHMLEAGAAWSDLVIDINDNHELVRVVRP